MLLRLNDIVSFSPTILPNAILTNLVKPFNSVLERLKLHLHTGIMARLVRLSQKRLERQYISIVGLTEIVKNEDISLEETSDLLSFVRKSLNSMRDSYDALEGLNFFHNSIYKSSFNKLLDAMYEMELALRKKASKNRVSAGNSEEAEITYRLQLQALESL